MAQAFAPNDPSVPANLRGRIESWVEHQPKSQYQQYGPLTALFSIKFPPGDFLVKPQGRLRELHEIEDMEEREILLEVLTDQFQPVWRLRNGYTGNTSRRLSVDSNGAIVDPKKYSLPDFIITSYSDMGVGVEHDIIRMIVEVGSMGYKLAPTDRYKHDVLFQLTHYMTALGFEEVRWENQATGMAIIGTEFKILHWNGGLVPEQTGWSSIYSPIFLQTLEAVAGAAMH